MKAWEYGKLRVSDNRKYLCNGDRPFFWLGDTAWLMFAKLTEEEAAVYLRNRKEKGYTSYKIRKEKLIGESQLQKIRTGEIASKETLNTICKLLNCQPGDILEYIEETE